MFGRQAMNLLECVCRLYEDDSTGKARTDFSNALNNIESRYFTRLSSPTTSTKGFILPNLGNNSGDLLLWSLFDVIRHGLAHQYQQIIVDLNDGHHYFVELTGALPGRIINKVRTGRPNDHLGYYIDKDNDVGIKIRPEILFLDFDTALNHSGLLGRNLDFDYLPRGAQSGQKFYNFDVPALIKSLDKSGHTKLV